MILLFSVGGVACAGDYEEGLNAAMRDDYVEAARLFKRAADQGNADAQLYLGMLYREGKGIPRNDGESEVRFRRAAEQGNPEAQFNLGLMYYEGSGVPQDFAESAKWYRLAARQGNGYAQTNLAHLYAEGLGVNRDEIRAHAWLYLAANSEDQGVAESAESMLNDLAAHMTRERILDAQNYAKACLGTNYRECD